MLLAGALGTFGSGTGSAGNQPFQGRAAGPHPAQVKAKLRHPVVARIRPDGAGQTGHVGFGPFAVGGVPGSVKADHKALVHGTEILLLRMQSAGGSDIGPKPDANAAFAA